MAETRDVAEARKAARKWIEGYGIRTEPYTRSGGDHPMMDTLPDAFLAFAAALRSPGLDRDGERMQEACARVCDHRAAYFDRAKGYREWEDAARSYRQTAAEIRALAHEEKAGC